MKIKVKFVIFTVLLGLVLFAATATASYLLSMQLVEEARAKHVSGIQEQVTGNMEVIIDQAEKVALILSQNKELINTVMRRENDPYHELERIKKVEDSLGLMKSYFFPEIEAIFISDRSGRVYMSPSSYPFNSEDVKSFNFFSISQFKNALSGKTEEWIKPQMFPESMPGIRIPALSIAFKDKCIFVKKIDDNLVISVTVNYFKMDQFVQHASAFHYSLSPAAIQEPLKNAFVSKTLRLERVGLSLHTNVEDPEMVGTARSNRISLVVVIVLLSLFTFFAALRFSKFLLIPIDKMKRHIEDLKNLNTAIEVIRYKTSGIKSQSFRIKIFLFLITVYMIGVLVIFTINSIFSAQQIKQDVQQYYEEYVFQSGKRLATNLSSLEKELNTIVNNEQIQTQLSVMENNRQISEEFKTIFSYQHVLSKDVNYLNLYNSRGEIVFSTINSFLNEGNIKTRNFFSALDKSYGETIYFNESKDPFGDHVITVARKLFSPKDYRNFIGYYTFALNERELEFLANNLGLASINFYITEKNGTILYNKNKQLIGEQWTGPESVLKSDKKYFTNLIDNPKKIILSDEMATTKWKLISIIDNSDIFRGTKEILLANGFLLLVLLFILFIFTFLLSNHIARPIKELVQHIRIVIGTKFQQSKLPVFGAKDEIGELSAHIQAMIETIQEQMNHIYEFEVRNREIQLEYKKAELSNLVQRINPHFLYNTLETIKWISMEITNGENKLTKMIKALSVYLRSGVHSGTKIVTLQEELEHVKAYLYIQQIRLGNKLKIKWNIHSEAAITNIVKFILQPVVENALIHGIEPKESRAFLLIQANIVGDKLIIVVADNGIGIAPPKLERIKKETTNGLENESIGLVNISKRLSLLYGDGASVRITSRLHHWTKVMIEIPVRQDVARLE